MQGSGRMGEKMLGELGLEENRCTAFVGAGGKTTAVYTCVGESLQKGLLAAAVTTTKMWKPKKGFVEWKAGDSVDEIRKKMFVFEDILMLDDRSIQRVLREVENSELAVALKNANEEVQNVIFNNMSTRLVDMIKEDMEYMGPVRLKDVEEAQQKIVNIIRKLEDSAEIVISRGGGDEIIV